MFVRHLAIPLSVHGRKAVMSPDSRLLSERVSAELERRISTGLYAVGTQMPSEPELGLDLSVSRPTVRDALSRLEARGLVERKRGRGTYVTAKPDPEITALL